MRAATCVWLMPFLIGACTRELGTGVVRSNGDIVVASGSMDAGLATFQVEVSAANHIGFMKALVVMAYVVEELGVRACNGEVCQFLIVSDHPDRRPGISGDELDPSEAVLALPSHLACRARPGGRYRFLVSDHHRLRPSVALAYGAPNIVRALEGECVAPNK